MTAGLSPLEKIVIAKGPCIQNSLYRPLTVFYFYRKKRLVASYNCVSTLLYLWIKIRSNLLTANNFKREHRELRVYSQTAQNSLLSPLMYQHSNKCYLLTFYRIWQVKCSSFHLMWHKVCCLYPQRGNRHIAKQPLIIVCFSNK